VNSNSPVSDAWLTSAVDAAQWDITEENWKLPEL
jgi:hypothetical protein